MLTISRHARNLATGLLLSLLAGAPALADDTEIYVGLNAGQTAVNPNVLFIIDTSGSMGTDVTITKDYDSSQTYTSDCPAGRIYWDEDGDAPDCDDDEWFRADRLRCKAAAAAMGSGGGGTYQDRLARWQPDSDDPEDSEWDELDEDVNDPPHVECQADRGVHGETDASTETYIVNEGGGPWQSGASGEENWNDTGEDYTLFTSNYLNWFHNEGGTVTKTRLQIVKDVVKNVVDANSNLNIGLMRFDTREHNESPSRNKGGPVIYAITDINAAGVRTAFKAKVDALTDEQYTPLAETLYEALRYYRGDGVVYGKSPPNDIKSVDASLDPSSSNKYKSPFEYECQKNFIVYLTDGDPTYDGDADTAIGKLLSGATLPSGDKTCAHGNDYDADDNCLDELAEYLQEADQSSLNGNQVINTYTIGFATDQALLQSAANKGNGKYFTANDYSELAAAFTQIIADIHAVNASFSAPAVSVNAFNRLFHRDELFFALFRPDANIHWPGNLKKFKIGQALNASGVAEGAIQILDKNGKPAVDANTGYFADDATSYWTPGSDAPDGGDPQKGGAASKLNDNPDNRKMYTYTGDYSDTAEDSLADSVNKLHENNRSGNSGGVITNAMVGLPAAATDADLEKLLKWARGVDVNDIDEDNASTDTRKVVGDPLHTNPRLVTYDGTTTPNPDITLYLTTNDGYLHAFTINDGQTNDGQERFSFVPKELLARMNDLYENVPIAGSGRDYGLDGTLTAWIDDENGDTKIAGVDDHVYLYFGQRRGGRNYYAVEATNRDEPKMLWRIEGGAGDFAELGQTWSAPKRTKVKIDNVEKDVVIFGGGYDPDQDGATSPTTDDQGRAIYIVDALTGARLWWAGPDASGAHEELAGMTNSIPSDIRIIDLNRDGLADRMYVGDMGGKLWRFDINNGESAGGLVDGVVMAELQKTSSGATPDAAHNRRFFYEPDTAFVDERGKAPFMSVSIGSGNRTHPLDKTVKDRFYMVRDPNPLQKPVDDDGNVSYPTEWPLTEEKLADITTTTTGLYNKQGWLLKLTNFSADASQEGTFEGEKVLTEARTFDGILLFSTFTPVASASASSCAPNQGTGRIYALNVTNGNSVQNLDDLGGDTNLTRTDRSYNLKSGGLPPEVALLFPEGGGGGGGGGSGGGGGKCGGGRENTVALSGTEKLTRICLNRAPVKTYWYATPSH